MPASVAERPRVVDLSVTLSEHLPCTWPGHMAFAHKLWSWFEEADLPNGSSCCSLGPYQTNFMIIDEHCGTHLDGPAHFIPPGDSDLAWASPRGDIGVDRVDLADLLGPAAVVDVRQLAGGGEPGVSPLVSRAELRRWEDRHGRFRAGEVVLLWTGWSAHYTRGVKGRKFVFDPLVSASSPGWPALAPEAAIHLHERQVKTIGIDAPSMGSVDDGAPVHQEGLSRGMLFVEMLTNLETLPARGAFFVFLPLKVAASSGGPGRAVAFMT